jgi:hypothetical protein
MPLTLLDRIIFILAASLAMLAFPVATLQAAGQPPAAPANLTGSIDNGVATLTWDIPSDDDTVEGFNIYIEVSDATISLSWEPSIDDEAVLGYNVYRDNQYLSTVRTPAYTGVNEANTVHSWYVVAFDIRTNLSARSQRIVLPDPGPVDTTLPPSVPEALEGQVTPGSNNDVMALTWQASTDDQAVAGYNIYRNRQYIATRFTTLYTGTVDTGSSNSFQVVAFDFDENFSRTSQGLTLPLGTGVVNPGVPPSVPTGLSGTTATTDGQTQVQLTWSASTSTVQVAGYNIYRNNAYRTTVFTNAYLDMEGFSEAGAKQAGPGGADELNLRIRQANVQANDSALYGSTASYTDIGFNFRTPAFVTAEDPLHEPVDSSTLAKEGTRIGMPLSFAKAALPATTRNIIFVPAAWAASGFCNTDVPAAGWNALPHANPSLGPTLLFDRALARINQTLNDTGGILRGILWHQGEADARDECAPLYEQNLTTLVSELRSRIIADARGTAARGTSANIPFVVGTMSKGMDERGDFSDFPPGKSVVDSVHRNITSLVPHSEVVVNDDLVPANGYSCGEASCIHFGADALREMGVRSYDALLRAAAGGS